MRLLCAVAWLAWAIGLPGQAPAVRPEFSPHQVGAASGYGNGWLWPEQVYSIYGKNLGPEEPCVRDANGFRPQGPNSAEAYEALWESLPRELCGVSVVIDEEPVPLIYVQARQVNFLTPRGRPTQNKVSLRLIYRGVSGIPVWLKFGPDRVGVWQQVEAFAGMPVWVRVASLTEPGRPIELMFGIGWIGPEKLCPHLEVEYNGVPLPERQSQNPPRQFVYSGPPCPAPQTPDRQSLAGRIPLHLRYAFDQPGFYRVRYVPGAAELRDTTAASEWSVIQVKAATAEQRTRWLRERAAAAPTDREGLIYDFLPSIFGYGDAATLRIGLEYLYHRDPTVAGTAAQYLRNYHPRAALLVGLQEIVQRRGRNAVVDGLLKDLGASR